MFRCVECQKEYADKPDYCECGNDTFEYIEEKVHIKEKPVKQPMTVEQKSQIVSLIFFVVCILLSLTVWIIPIKSATEEVTIKEEKSVVKNIPNIDKFWDSTPVKVQEIEQPKSEFTKEPIPLNVIPYESKPVAKPVAKPVQKTAQQKVTQQPKQQVNTPKQQTKPQAKKVEKKPVQTAQRQVIQQQTKPKEKEQPKTRQETQKPKTVYEQPKVQDVKPVEQPKKVYNPNSPQMLKYKGELRAALFRKLPVGSIQGSGTCSVHFSVDSTGKLVNRAFTRQSDNKSLNDAVYYMLMSVPRFSVPPSEYSGEMINMTFKINNGSYEITIN